MDGAKDKIRFTWAVYTRSGEMVSPGMYPIDRATPAKSTQDECELAGRCWPFWFRLCPG